MNKTIEEIMKRVFEAGKLIGSESRTDAGLDMKQVMFEINTEVQKEREEAEIAKDLLSRLFHVYKDVDEFVSATFEQYMAGGEVQDNSIQMADLYEQVESFLSQTKGGKE